MQRVAGINRLQKTTAGVAKIGDGIERDVGHGLAEHHVKHQEIVDRRTRITDRGCENIGRLHGEAWPEQTIVNRDITERDSARGSVADLLAEAKILEKIAGIGFADELTQRGTPSRFRFGRASLTEP